MLRRVQWLAKYKHEVQWRLKELIKCFKEDVLQTKVRFNFAHRGMQIQTTGVCRYYTKGYADTNPPRISDLWVLIQDNSLHDMFKK